MDAGTLAGIIAIVISAFAAFLLWACVRVGSRSDRS